MLYSIQIIHSAFSVKYNEIVERMDNDGTEFIMEDRISLLQLTGLNPFADQDFFPAKRFHSKSLRGKKKKATFYHLFARLKDITLGTLQFW